MKGVFLRLDPKSVQDDLEDFRKRENRDTERSVLDSPEHEAETHFWTMGSNLDLFPEFRSLNQERLANVLAHRAKSITNPGKDGVLPVDYIRRVHAFDPDDRITALIVRNL